MQSSQKRALSSHRRRLKQQGIVRLEVRVRKEDVSLVRGVVAALADTAGAAEARKQLRERFPMRKGRGLKALLASAPLEGIDLRRSRKTGRDVDL
jgi:hypothetical protein